MQAVTFCFASEFFQLNLISEINGLLTENTFADVTLVSDDQIMIPAHRFVLSACSPVLKNILVNNPHSHPLLYLRGVKQQELRYILEYMYTGKVTISQDRIKDFIDIAISFEIKDIGRDFKIEEINTQSTEVSAKIDDSVHEADTENMKLSKTRNELLESVISGQEERLEQDKSYITKLFKCKDCEAVYASKKGLFHHTESKHDFIKYPCVPCDHKATTAGNLKTHQESVHEGIKYFCNQCKYETTRAAQLKIHKEYEHEGVRYACQQCEYKTITQRNLNRHRRSKH